MLTPTPRRSRRPRASRVVAVLLTLALIGAAALGVRRLLRDSDPAAAAGCPAVASPAPAAAPAPVAAPPAPSQVHVRVLNGTSRRGLAKQVAADLAARGFVVDGTGNAAAPQQGPTSVLFGAAAQPAAALLAAHVLGATTAPAPPTAAATSLDLLLGPGYERLRTPEEVAALAASAAATPAPATGCR